MTRVKKNQTYQSTVILRKKELRFRCQLIGVELLKTDVVQLQTIQTALFGSIPKHNWGYFY